MNLKFTEATPSDAIEIANLHNAVSEKLTLRYGKGHWSSSTTEKSVLFGIRNSFVLIGRDKKRLIATLRLATKKPWAIVVEYFSKAKRPLYLTHMAVKPDLQEHGIGRVVCKTVPLIYYELLL